MASTTKRRPLPALVALVALLLLTGLVWWRVLNRSGATASSPSTTPCPTHTAAVTLPAQRAVTVQVLNATTRQGIASKARNALVAAGFTVPSAAANDSKKYLNKIPGVAQIRFGTAERAGATLLHFYLPGAVLVPTTSTSKVVVVSLGRKYITIASNAAVAAALKKADTVAGSPTPSAAASC